MCRYRLGVRTDGSQPSNRGSNPRSGILFTFLMTREALDQVIGSLTVFIYESPAPLSQAASFGQGFLTHSRKPVMKWRADIRNDL